jgi:hypothetical protein
MNDDEDEDDVNGGDVIDDVDSDEGEDEVNDEANEDDDEANNEPVVARHRCVSSLCKESNA